MSDRQGSNNKRYKHVPPPAAMPSAPFFIVGASRSGTTMLRLMLNAHSRLGVPDELKYLQTVAPTVTRDSWKTPLRDEAYQAVIDTYAHHRPGVLDPSDDRLLAALSNAPDRTLRGPYTCLLQHWADAHDKERWGEKTPSNLFYVDVLSDMYPEAKFIHLLRDPRAVVQSMNAIPYYSDDTVFNALNWRKSIREGQRLFHEYLRPDQQLTVRYEDLVTDPEPTLTRICEFLGESFEPQMLQFYRTADQYMAQKIKTPSIKAPVNQDSLTKWKRRLPHEDVRTIEMICGREMDELRYARDTSSPALPNPVHLFKASYWRWKAWRHRDQRGYEVGFPFLAGLRSRLARMRRGLFSAHPSA